MTDHDVPEYARAALRGITDQVDELRTQRIRFRAAVADMAARSAFQPLPDPAERLQQAATERDAPAELVRLARAVRDGRTTWPEIVAGGANALPEVVALRVRITAEIGQLVESGALRDLQPSEQDDPTTDAPRAPAQRRTTRDDDEPDELPINWVRG